MQRKLLIGALFLPLALLFFWLIRPEVLVPPPEKGEVQQLEQYLERSFDPLSELVATQEPEAWTTAAGPGGVNIMHYREDSLVRWLNNLAVPPAQIREVLRRATGYVLLELPTGVFVCKRLATSGADSGDYFGLVQILAATPSATGMIRLTLPPELQTGPTGYYEIAVSGTPLHTPDGQPLTYLQRSGPAGFGPWWPLLFAGAILLLLLTGALTFRIFGLFLSSRPAWQRACIDLLLLIGLYVSCQPFVASLFAVAPFQVEPNTALFLGRLLTGAILLTPFSLYRLLQPGSMRWWLPGPWRAVPAYTGVIGGMFVLLKISEAAVYQSGIDFFFPDVFHVQPTAWFAVAALILLMFVVYLWSMRWIRGIQEAGLSARQRMLNFLPAFLLILIPFFTIGSQTPFVAFLIGTVALTSLMDQFVESQQRDLTWLIVWLMVFAGFSASLLFNLQNKKPTDRQVATAETLASPIDPLLQSFVADLPENIGGSVDRQKEQWRIAWNTNPYLPAYYTYQTERATANAPRNTGLVTEQWGQYRYRWSDSLQIRIQQRDVPEREWRYEPFTLPPLRGINTLERYHYAVYDAEGKRIAANPDAPFPTDIDQAEPGESPEYKRQRDPATVGRYEAFSFSNGTRVRLKYRDQSLIKPISLFSFLFTVLFLLTPLMAVLQNIAPFLPRDLRFNWSAQSSLGNRIQIYVLALIVVSFLVIGSVTVVYFRQTEEIQIMERNQERLDAVRDELENLLTDTPPEQLPLNRIAASHRQGVRLFATEGQLIQQSDGFAARLGLSPELASWQAIEAIRNGKQDYQLVQERIGARTYDVVYRTSATATEKPAIIFGFPLPEAGQAIRTRVAGFFGMLLNVYAFLLLIAGAVAIAVAGSITQPLTRLRSSLTQVKLGRNEPIPYSGRDELGVLIREYNLMLEKLEESTRQLSRTERESAWREMAKRVAHEIRNPLTPMKLRLQHLRYVMNTDLEAAKPMVESTTQTLIEQIQALDEIASAFSSFAKMPEAEAQRLELRELVTAAHELFRSESRELNLQLAAPDAPIWVEVDKNQMIRVFNNLYKNAEQAIPEDRPGEIRTQITTRADRVVVKVCDNGTGIPEDAQAKVFELEFTTKSFGSGLGLAMAKDIVTSFGGDIYFQTEANKGTCFFIELPLLSAPTETK